MSAYSGRFDDAVAFALDAFRDIYRKGKSVPYMTHLLSVTALVGEAGGDEDQLCAAVLHDAVEDVPGCTPEIIEARFGGRVSRMVVALSDSVNEQPKPPWKARKDRYLAHLRDMPHDVKLVSAADKLHNARCIRQDLQREGVASMDRFTGGRDGTVWYYRAVTGALGAGWSHWLVDELDAEVTRIEALARG